MVDMDVEPSSNVTISESVDESTPQAESEEKQPAQDDQVSEVVEEEFTSFSLQEPILDALKDMKYLKPTQVQAKVFPPALEGKDLIAQSRTGSGKTCAFGVPMIQRFEACSAASGKPRGLILVPTRELAQQVANELRALAAVKGNRIMAVYGGVSLGRQAALLRSGMDIIVATPGRLLDHMRRGNVALEEVEVVVLDEADEMLSMGFWDDITDILSKVPATPERQTMLFSATLPYQIAKAAAQWLKEPVKIDLSGDDLTVDGIENFICHLESDIPKPRQLLYLLEELQVPSAIVFCNTRNETEMIAKYLMQNGLVAEAISGGFRQIERDRVIAKIKAGKLQVMVATDIAARGLDVADLPCVINYSLPEFSEVYLHRVGRTGRAGKKGQALSLVDGKGLSTLSTLEREFSIVFEKKQLPDADKVLKLRSDRIMTDLKERADVAEVGQHVPVAKELQKTDDGAQVIAYLLKSYFTSQVEKSKPAPAPEPEQRARPAQTSRRDDDDQNNQDPRRRRRRRTRGRNDNAGSDHQQSQGGRRRNDSYGSNESNESGNRTPQPSEGHVNIRINLGFDAGFKSRGSVAKKIAALAGLNDGSVTEVELRRHHAILTASNDIASLVLDRVQGAAIGKKVLEIQIQNNASQQPPKLPKDTDEKSATAEVPDTDQLN